MNRASHVAAHAENRRLLAAGYSRRSQVKLVNGSLPHPAQALLARLLPQPMLEENLRRAMLLSRGSPSVFVTHPLSLGLLLVAAALLVIVVMPTVRSKREEAFSE